MTYNVLFLCTGNSARSILAEAILGKLAPGKFKAWSAGSQPKGTVHPQALALLRRLGVVTEGFRSKSWAEFSDGPQFDFIFTVCDSAASVVCPIWPGHPMTTHWGIPDPAAIAGDDLTVARAFQEAYDALERRIGRFAELPIQSLDRLSLKKMLDEIGETHNAT